MVSVTSNMLNGIVCECYGNISKMYLTKLWLITNPKLVSILFVYLLLNITVKMCTLCDDLVRSTCTAANRSRPQTNVYMQDSPFTISIHFSNLSFYEQMFHPTLSNALLILLIS